MKRSYKELFNDIKSQETNEKLLEEISKIKPEIKNLKYLIKVSDSSLEENKNKLKQINNLKNKIFNRKEYRQNKSDLERMIKCDMEKLKERYKKVKLLEDRYEEIKKSLPFSENDITSKEKIHFEILDGFIYINSDNLKSLQKQEISSIEDIDEKILVHSTGFFPKNNKILTGVEGRKLNKSVEITYKNFTRKFPTYSARHTVHFIENNVVSDHMSGTFSSDYIILEPLKNHASQIVNEDPSDTWIRGSVALSKDSIILVKRSKLKEIPKDFIEGHNIILYDGDRKVCVENLLNSMGYPISKIDLGYKGHSRSIDSHLEDSIISRNRMISFFENKMIYYNDFVLNDKKMLVLYDLYKYSFCSYESLTEKFLNETITKKLCEKQNLDFDIFKFFINFGMSKKEDNYIPLSYDKMLELEKIINDKHFGEIQFNNLIKELGMLDFQEKLIQNNKSKKNETIIDQRELLSKSFSEINNFKNLESAAELQKNIRQIFEHINPNVSVSFDFKGLNVEFSVKENDLEQYLNDDYDIKVEEDAINHDEKKVLFNLDCSDLLCEEVIEQCIKYVSSINKLTHKKI